MKMQRFLLPCILAVAIFCLPAEAVEPDNSDEPQSAEDLVPGFSRSGGIPKDIDDETLNRILQMHQVAKDNVRMILLPVAVTNKRGRTVRGLIQDEFQILEDSIPQKIEFFSLGNHRSDSYRVPLGRFRKYAADRQIAGGQGGDPVLRGGASAR